MSTALEVPTPTKFWRRNGIGLYEEVDKLVQDESGWFFGEIVPNVARPAAAGFHVFQYGDVVISHIWSDNLGNLQPCSPCCAAELNAGGVCSACGSATGVRGGARGQIVYTSGRGGLISPDCVGEVEAWLAHLVAGPLEAVFVVLDLQRLITAEGPR